MLTLAIAAGEPPARQIGRKVNEWFDDCGEVLARAFSCESLHWIDWLGVGVFAFSAGSRDVRVWPEPDTQHEVIVETFSRMLQPVILQALGWQALHAGATVGPAGALAFCGRKGSGKSTLAYAMQQAGWRQFSDDALVLRLDHDCVKTCPLPFTPRLRPASRTHFADAHYAALSSSEQQIPDVPLTAVFILQQDASLSSPRISLVPQARAFSMVLAHAHCFNAKDPRQTRQLVEDYLRLVARVPVFTLEYSPIFQHLPQLTRAVVEVASGIGAAAVFSSGLQPTGLLA